MNDMFDWSKIKEALYNCVAYLVLLISYAFGMCIGFLFTFSGIGPIFQCYLEYIRVRDSVVGIDYVVVPRSDWNSLPYKISYRYSESGAFPFPICIANDIGMSLVSSSALHDSLVLAGFKVLSYDRCGVGMSETSARKYSSAEEIIREMGFMMRHVCQELEDGCQERKWILMGIGMGSVVSQAYIAAYPSQVAGFISLNGLSCYIVQVRIFCKAHSKC